MARICSDDILFERAIARLPGEAATLSVRRGGERAKNHRWAEAAADIHRALLLEPEQIQLGHRYLLLLQAAGMASDLARARSELLARLAGATGPRAANEVVWLGVITPGGETHSEMLVRLAERVLNESSAAEKASVLNTLGAAFYRAGRFADAIRSLEEGIARRDGKGDPQDWAFLAMANQRLGRTREARQWLDRFRGRRPDPDPNQVWNELEVRLLRDESESLIVYDPLFPRDPFTH